VEAIIASSPARGSDRTERYLTRGNKPAPAQPQLYETPIRAGAEVQFEECDETPETQEAMRALLDSVSGACPT
jgi:hypothetical protein